MAMTTKSGAVPTLGPWKYERIVMSKYGKDAYFEVRQDREDDESVGMFARDICQTIMREIDDEASLLAEDEANAKLIAAAPGLLEALREIVENAEYQRGTTYEVSTRYIEAAAISLATGKDQR